MNTYKHEFVSTCPNNGKSIIYRLKIKSTFMIQVEHIVLACQLFKSGYHEQIAASLHQRFGGHHVLKAHHHGVDIVTRIGTAEQRPEPVRTVPRDPK